MDRTGKTSGHYEVRRQESAELPGIAGGVECHFRMSCFEELVRAEYVFSENANVGRCLRKG
jgi:hypothetical protein